MHLVYDRFSQHAQENEEAAQNSQTDTFGHSEETERGSTIAKVYERSN